MSKNQKNTVTVTARQIASALFQIRRKLTADQKEIWDSCLDVKTLKRHKDAAKADMLAKGWNFKAPEETEKTWGANFAKLEKLEKLAGSPLDCVAVLESRESCSAKTLLERLGIEMKAIFPEAHKKSRKERPVGMNNIFAKQQAELASPSVKAGLDAIKLAETMAAVGCSPEQIVAALVAANPALNDLKIVLDSVGLTADQQVQALLAA